jgi:hypothetical protein
MTLDEARSAYPHLGLAVYAFEPGGAVTLEVHVADGQSWQFTAATEAAALALAFPAEEPAPEPPPINIFD